METSLCLTTSTSMKYSVLKLFVGAITLLMASGCATAASSNSATAILAAEHGAPAALVTTLQRGERLVLADIEMLATLQVLDDTTLVYP